MRLFASVFADNPRVDWTIDGISGGSAQVGSVDPMGLYRAPAQAPPSGSVTIRATTSAARSTRSRSRSRTRRPPQPAPATAAELASIEASRPVGHRAGSWPAEGGRRGERPVPASARGPGRFGVVRIRARPVSAGSVAASSAPGGPPAHLPYPIPRSVAALEDARHDHPAGSRWPARGRRDRCAATPPPRLRPGSSGLGGGESRQHRTAVAGKHLQPHGEPLMTSTGAHPPSSSMLLVPKWCARA